MSDPSIIKQRLSEFAYAIGKNKRQFTKDIGVSESFLVSKGGITEEKIINIISIFPQLNANWLLTGKGDMILFQPGDFAENELNLSGNSTDKNSMKKNEYMTKSPVMARLVQYIKYIGKSVNAFEAEWGVSKNYIRNTERYIKPEYLDKLMSDHPDIDLNWLIAGRGSMLLSETENLSENKTNLAKQNKKEERLFSIKEVNTILNKQKEVMTEEFGKIIMEKMTHIIEGQLDLLKIQVKSQSETIQGQKEMINNVLDKINGVEEKTGKIVEMVERKIG